MFQTYDPVSDPTAGSKNLPLLRAQLAVQQLDGFIIPHDDEYQNEYIPAYAERLLWATGFSGSAGAAIVTHDKAAIFVDGRYTLQVRQQTDNTLFTYEDIAVTSLGDWLSTHVPAEAKIGYDAMLHSPAGLARLEAAAKKTGFSLIAVTPNPVDEAWESQPPPPKAPITIQPLEYAGQAREEKCAQLAQKLADAGADAVLIASPPSVAWLLNIRGGDVARTPVALARVLLTRDGDVTLYIDPDKADADTVKTLSAVTIKPETALLDDLTGFQGKTISLDPASTPAAFVTVLNDNNATILNQPDPCLLPKAIKNASELAGTRAAHIRDGVAVTKFLHWLATDGQSGSADEITAAQKLESFRRESNLLKDISFDTISGAGPNGAIVHYRVDTNTNHPLSQGSLYLVDSGGQYLDGTTDITRTVAIGKPSDEMRDRFTRVLKGHIAIATARFPTGTSGHQLDMLARLPLWEAGLDFDHGTGHGVGSYLSVHEGPQYIAKRAGGAPLEAGMILSNEPGYYKPDAYGIRIENLVIVTPPSSVENGEREMMGFETITLAPIDLTLVKASLLREHERHWLNKYHALVRQTLRPHLPKDVSAWLSEVTRSI